MNDRLDTLLGQVRQLEREMTGEARKKESEFRCKIRLTAPPPADAAAAPTWRGLPDYILHSRFLVLVSSPVIWLCVVPIALADLVGSLYQAVCFPIYGIPKVRRSDYLAFDRHHLTYLNFFEKVNCEYCAYVNGILAYFTEIAARTEQHWCPIKHAGCVKCAHSRYKTFVEYGNAETYRQKFEEIRRSYQDISSAA